MRRATLVLFCVAVVPAFSQTFTKLADFDVANGTTPFFGPLLQGSDGNLYGTTFQGGAYNAGTTFRVTLAGSLTSLHSFGQGPSDPARALGSLIQAKDGNYYGTTYAGGTTGQGTIFQMSPQGEVTTFHSFCPDLQNCTDGSQPGLALLLAADGNFYGVTQFGGPPYFGTIYRITPAGVLTTLHVFSGTADGAQPSGGLVQGPDNRLYGTTGYGGNSYCPAGCGTIFTLDPVTSHLETLYAFCEPGACPHGSTPSNYLTLGKDGIFYGTTIIGNALSGKGTVFSITAKGDLKTIYSFCPLKGCPDGANPFGALMQDANGNLYGTTSNGGTAGQGTIFRLTPGGKLTTLHNFLGDDGAAPESGLVLASDGSFYGTTLAGGAYNAGVIYRLTVDFNLVLAVTKSGSGIVTSDDGMINCGSACSATYESADVVNLTATPSQQWTFGSWTGCDTVQDNVCTVTLQKSRNVTATFNPILYPLTVLNFGGGLGTVTTTDGHINCPGVCSYSYPYASKVTLIELPAPGYTFGNWNGCASTNERNCYVTITTPANVGAQFINVGDFPVVSLTFKPSSMKGGQLAVGTITLGSPTHPGGLTVALSTDHPADVHPPPYVFVPGGKKSFSFSVRTTPTRAKTVATLTATVNASQKSGTLTLTTNYTPSKSQGSQKSQQPTTSGTAHSSQPTTSLYRPH